MNNQIEIEPLVDAGYVQKTIANGQNAVFKNGRLVYIILDVDKPGKYFFDLRDVFNASTGEGGKDLKILFMNNNVPFDMNGKTVSIAGIYPNRVPFHVTGAQNQASSSLIDFVFPLGLFQQAGIYKFQFQITDESQNQATSHYCFFQVTQNSTLMAVDYNNGVNPFDSDYNEWKAEVDTQIKSILEQLKSVNTAADADQALLNSYINKAQSYVETATQDAINKLLSSENAWTGKQHFNNGLTFSNNAQGDTLVANQVDTTGLTVTGNATLPAGTSVGGLFNLQNVLRKKPIDGGISSMLNGTGALNPIADNNSKFWCWGERYEDEANPDSWIHFFFYFCFSLDCNDVGKPIAQFKSPGFLTGANNGPVSIPIESGSAVMHLDSNSNCIVLDNVYNISGNVVVRDKFWI